MAPEAAKVNEVGPLSEEMELRFEIDAKIRSIEALIAEAQRNVAVTKRIPLNELKKVKLAGFLVDKYTCDGQAVHPVFKARGELVAAGGTGFTRCREVETSRGGHAVDWGLQGFHLRVLYPECVRWGIFGLKRNPLILYDTGGIIEEGYLPVDLTRVIEGSILTGTFDRSEIGGLKRQSTVAGVVLEGLQKASVPK